MVCVPKARAEVEIVAVPAPLSGTGPPWLTLSITNCTVPVGTGPPGLPVTVMEMVTACPTPDGFGFEVNVDPTGAATNTFTTADLPGVKQLSPVAVAAPRSR